MSYVTITEGQTFSNVRSMSFVSGPANLLYSVSGESGLCLIRPGDTDNFDFPVSVKFEPFTTAGSYKVEVKTNGTKIPVTQVSGISIEAPIGVVSVEVSKNVGAFPRQLLPAGSGRQGVDIVSGNIGVKSATPLVKMAYGPRTVGADSALQACGDMYSVDNNISALGFTSVTDATVDNGTIYCSAVSGGVYSILRSSDGETYTVVKTCSTVRPIILARGDRCLIAWKEPSVGLHVSIAHRYLATVNEVVAAGDGTNDGAISAYAVTASSTNFYVVYVNDTLFSNDYWMYEIDIAGNYTPPVTAQVIYVDNQPTQGTLSALHHDGADLWAFTYKSTGGIVTASNLSSTVEVYGGIYIAPSVYIPLMYDSNLNVCWLSQGKVGVCNLSNQVPQSFSSFNNSSSINNVRYGWPSQFDVNQYIVRASSWSSTDSDTEFKAGADLYLYDRSSETATPYQTVGTGATCMDGDRLFHVSTSYTVLQAPTRATVITHG